MTLTLARLLKRQNHATSIEHALIIALISVVAIAAFEFVGTNLGMIFNTGATRL